MKLKSIELLALGMMALLACENRMTFETDVHEDGTFEKSIIFEKRDSAYLDNKMFGISPAKGWAVSITKLPPEGKTEKEKEKTNYRVKFDKHFNSVEEMNTALNSNADTLFSIKSTFEKKFRGFYTYIRYTETFMPINHFKMLPATDFLNQEDFQFIERLPNEGSPISKADSVWR